MAKQKHWSIILDDTPYEIDFYKSEISINGGPYIKIGALEKGHTIFHGANPILVGNKILKIHTQPMADPVLTYEGINCETNEPYTPAEFPKWGWIFMVLHALNFLFLIGGAIGGVLTVLFLWPTIGIAMNQNKHIAIRVLQCFGIWILAFIVDVLIIVILTLLKQI